MAETEASDINKDQILIKNKRKKANKSKKESKKKKKIRNKAFSQGYISYGGKNISIPTPNHKVMKTLKAKSYYSIKNPKTKRAFMYTSPWAAVKTLGLYKNESFDGLAQYAAISEGMWFMNMGATQI